MPPDLQHLKKAVEKKEMEVIRKTAHKLKTSYGTLKADKGFAICHTIENSSNMKHVKEDVDLLHQYSLLLIAALKKDYKVKN